jgi:hypothetical protein
LLLERKVNVTTQGINFHIFETLSLPHSLMKTV